MTERGDGRAAGRVDTADETGHAAGADLARASARIEAAARAAHPDAAEVFTEPALPAE